MAALSAIVDQFGISAPTYAEVLAGLQDSYRLIYGSDVYLEADSQDGQFLALIALAIKNSNDMAIAIYNSFSPATAQGIGLSSVIKVNGIKRHSASNSTATVTLIGQAGTIIENGIIRDNLNLGNTWSLPGLVTIPESGEINVTAICNNLGNITAQPDTLTEIATPVPGWQTVTNDEAATPGAPVETDATLRRRQSKSVALPAQTPLEAIYAAVANVTGVARASAVENDSGIISDDGIPPRTIAIVTQGGSVSEIAEAIALKKPPGVPTYGNISFEVINSLGIPNTINFSDLNLITMSVLVYVQTLNGYVTSTTDKIKASVSTYVKELDINEPSYYGRIYAPADLRGTEAVESTGLPQNTLDQLSNTYHITTIAQARSDMSVTGGPYSTGASAINLTRVSDIHDGDIIYLSLSDLSYFKTIVTDVTGLSVTFSPAIPVGKSVANGSLVYVMNDVGCVFDEALTAETTDVILLNAQNNSIL